MDPAHLLPSVTKIVLGVGEERQGPAESSGDLDVAYRQPLPRRQEAQSSEIALPCRIGTPNTARRPAARDGTDMQHGQDGSRSGSSNTLSTSHRPGFA